MKNAMFAIGAYDVPMDGINEKGLCVSILEVNEGGPSVDYYWNAGYDHIAESYKIEG